VTSEEANRLLSLVVQSVDDGEAAHAYEDELHIAVLRAISAGEGDARALAAIALKSCELDFCRLCA